MFTRVASLHDIPASGRLFIYGAGAAGQAMAALLAQRANRVPFGYIDSRCSNPLGSPPTIKLDDYVSQRLDNDAVLICSSHVVEIRAALREHSIPAFDAADMACSLVTETARLAAILQDGRLILTRA